MPVKPESRYAKLPSYEIVGPDGSPRKVLGIPWKKNPQPSESIRHRLRQRDDIDLLSFRFYGDERLWWRILDANPLVYPLDLEPGTMLEIPTRESTKPVTRARKF